MVDDFVELSVSDPDVFTNVVAALDNPEFVHALNENQDAYEGLIETPEVLNEVLTNPDLVDIIIENPSIADVLVLNPDDVKEISDVLTANP